MPDDTTTALQALMQQVQALTERVEAQDLVIASTKEHNDRLLDQIKDDKRAKQPDLLAVLEQEQRDRALANSNLVRDANGNLRLASKVDADGAVVLSREDARDPVKYREARARAADRGVPLRVLSDSVDPTIRDTGKPEIMKSKVFTFDDTHERIRYIRADMEAGTGLVQRRMQAEREGLKVRTFRTLDDLPPHARSKFQMMEGAANATDS